MKDGEIVKILRRLDALMWKQRQLLDLIETGGHPHAEAMYEDLDRQCAQYAWATHVGSHHLEHPDRYETGDFGIRRKAKES